MAIADEKQTMTTAFSHPFADMGAVSRSELVIERGEGVHVFDDQGRRYLDGTASLWYANLGHGREEIAEAVADQIRTLAAYSTFGDFGNKPSNELCERLARLAPMEDARVFLGSGGGAFASVAGPPLASPAYTSQNVAGVDRLVAGQAVQVQALQGSGVDLPVRISRFEMALMGGY